MPRLTADRSVRTTTSSRRARAAAPRGSRRSPARGPRRPAPLSASHHPRFLGVNQRSLAPLDDVEASVRGASRERRGVPEVQRPAGTRRSRPAERSARAASWCSRSPRRPARGRGPRRLRATARGAPRLPRGRAGAARAGRCVGGAVAAGLLLAWSRSSRPSTSGSCWRSTGRSTRHRLALRRRARRDGAGAAPGASAPPAGPAAAVLVGLLVLVPLAVLRVTRAAVRHRAPPVGCWPCPGALAGAQRARRPHGVGSGRLRAAAGYGLRPGRARPSQLRDQREFTRAAAADPERDDPAGAAHRAARQGRAAGLRRELRARRLDDPGLSPGSTRSIGAGGDARRWASSHAAPGYLADLRRAQLARALHPAVRALGRQPAALRPPRHRRPADPDQPVRRAGWRTVAAVPANTRDWPQGETTARPGLRLAQPRLPRPPVRLRDHAGPVLPRRAPPPRARAATAAQ